MEFLRLFLKQFANKKFSTFSNGLKINRTELSISVLENPLLKLYTEFCSTTYHEIQPLLIRLFCEIYDKLLGRHGYHTKLKHLR